MKTRHKIYFGHPVNVYNTPLEAGLLLRIASAFPLYDVENPNQPHHQDGYKRWKEKTGNGMDYYYQEVLPNCFTGIFLPFRDNTWGAGVYNEAEFFVNQERSIWKINHQEFSISILPIKLAGEIHLSLEETRARIYLNGKDPSEGFKPF